MRPGIAMVGVLHYMQHAAAQEARAAIALGLGAAEGPAGSTVLVMATLTAPDGQPIKAIGQAVRFDHRVLAFVSANLDPDARFEVNASAAPDPADADLIQAVLPQRPPRRPTPLRILATVDGRACDATSPPSANALHVMGWTLRGDHPS